MKKTRGCQIGGIRAAACWTVAAIGLLLAGGCATTESVKYDPILSYKFKPRPTPARITRDSAKTLEKTGYFELGSIRAFYPTSTAEDKKARAQLEDMLLKEAARQGGDVVRLDVENQAHTENDPVKDKCFSWVTRRQSTYENVPYEECSGYPLKCVYKTRMELVHRDVRECVNWTYKDNFIPGRLSSGSVWRHDPQMKDMSELGASELPRAAGEGQVKVVKLLLQRGASVNAYDSEGYTALHRAVEKNQLGMARLLLDNKANVNALTTHAKRTTSPLCLAVSNDQTEMIKLLLARGADVNKADGPGDNAGDAGMTPLMWASQSNKPEIINLLLDRGANINATIESGTWIGMTPLMRASWRGTPNGVKALVARGAKVNPTDSSGRRALHWAAGSKGQVEAIKLLVARGSNVNWQDIYGNTSLMLAAREPEAGNVKALLALGADRSLRNKKGKTAMDLVKDQLEQSGTIYFEAERREIMKLLSQ